MRDVGTMIQIIHQAGPNFAGLLFSTSFAALSSWFWKK